MGGGWRRRWVESSTRKVWDAHSASLPEGGYRRTRRWASIPLQHLKEFVDFVGEGLDVGVGGDHVEEVDGVAIAGGGLDGVVEVHLGCMMKTKTSSKKRQAKAFPEFTIGIDLRKVARQL